MNELALVSRFALATVFMLAGAAKVARRHEFTEAVRNYRLLPGWVSGLVGFSLPPAELLVGVLLLLGLATTPVAAGAAVCLLAFMIAITVNLLRGRRIECGCYGLMADSHLSWSSVARNVLLLSAALLVASRPLSVPSSIGAAWLIVASAATLAGGLSQEGFRLHRLAKATTTGGSR